ncbi:MAG: SEC-C metal-binding domain-containing protein [Myxococcota bacterium]
MKVGRNDPCPCGSGRKYKSCCEGKATAKEALYSRGLPILLGLVLVAVAVLIAAAFYSSAPTDGGAKRVWSVEHGHWHDANGRQVP